MFKYQWDNEGYNVFLSSVKSNYTHLFLCRFVAVVKKDLHL